MDLHVCCMPPQSSHFWLLSVSQKHPTGTHIPVELIEAPFKNRSVADIKRMAARTLLPISVQGDRQYFISVRHGDLQQREVCAHVCVCVCTCANVHAPD